MWQLRLSPKNCSINYIMQADVKKLLLAQFLTAMADNAILFIAVAMVLQGTLQGDWYIPALQGSFLVAFVLLAPWVGRFADTHAKPHVLAVANGIKMIGAGLMLLGVEPLLAYATVGIGAATYSPAKYGILPEITHSDDALSKSNSWVEASTIIAILSGTVVGAKMADFSIPLALYFALALYFSSAACALWMRNIPAAHAQENKGSIGSFKLTIRTLFSAPKARFATMGVSLFWASAVSLRLIIITWAPITLFLTTSEDISKLTLFIALGIAIGAMMAPKWIPIGRVERTRWAAYSLGITIFALFWVADITAARILLLIAGICGGLFVVPMNALLQEIGHRTVGSGHTVAVQHFFENLAMLTATGLYAWALNVGLSATTTLLVLGFAVLSLTFFISRHLPR